MAVRRNHLFLVCSVVAVSIMLSVPAVAAGGDFQLPTIVSDPSIQAQIVIGDFNGDGKTDFLSEAVISGDTDNYLVSAFLGKGSGKFGSPISFKLPRYFGLRAIDVNGDGKLDLMAAQERTTPSQTTTLIMVMLGNGDGTFQAPKISDTKVVLQAFAAGDFNRDGKIDVVGETSAGFVSTIGNGDGTFAPPSTLIPAPNAFNGSALAAADVNLDGKLDIIYAAVSGANRFVAVLPGNGDGTFGASVTTQLGGVPVAVVDLNQDGKPDIVYDSSEFNTVNPTSIAVGNGDLTFRKTDQSAGYFVAVADMNNDGKPDLITMLASQNILSGPVAIQLGRGDGTFGSSLAYDITAGELQASSSGFNPTALFSAYYSIADFDGDGKLDVASVNSGFVEGRSIISRTSRSISIASGNGNGRLQAPQVFTAGNITPGTYPSVAAAGDFNGDGKPDVVYWANRSSNLVPPSGLFVQFGDGYQVAGSPSITATPFNVGSLAAGDFNGDGKLDVVAGSATSGFVVSMLGAGDGTFSTGAISIVGGTPGYVASADLNGDGNLDVVTANSSGTTITVLIGNGDGTFQSGVDYSVAPGPSWVAIGDFNKDGKLDLAVTANNAAAVALQNGAGAGNTVSVLLGNGDGTFKPAVSYTVDSFPTSVVAGDFNRDGKLDLAVACSFNPAGTFPTGAGTVDILAGNGDGTFQSSVSTTTGFMPGSIRAADMNGDGKIDLIMSAYDPSLFNSGIMELYGNGDGTFQAPVLIPAAPNPQVLNFVLADFNADGKMDVATTSGELLLGSVTSLTPASMVLSVSPSDPVYGQSITFNVSVSGTGGTPTGNVSFYDNGVQLFNGAPAIAPLTNGSATLTYTPFFSRVSALPLLAGPHKFVAFYTGDAAFGSAEATRIVTISKAPTTTSVASGTPASGSNFAVVSTVATTSQYQDLQVHGTITVSEGATVLGTASVGFGAPTFSTTYTLNLSLSQGTHNLNVVYSGDSAYLGSSGSITATIGPPDFAMGAASGGSMTATVTAGQAANYNLSLTPSGGFSGTVTLTCSGAPTAASCAVSPASMNVSGTAAAPFSVSVTTTSRTVGASVLPRPTGPAGWMIVLLFGGLASAWFGRWRKRVMRDSTFAKRGQTWGTLGMLVVLALIVGCGGGSSSTKPPVQSGTPAGTYTIVVSATSGSTTHTQNLTLTVN